MRLAGAYALARLADEWEEQRQTCVDVLCAYLRMQPKMTTYQSEDGYPYNAHDEGDMEVRHTISGLIASRIGTRQTGGVWSNCELNLRDAYLIDFALQNVRLRKTLIVRGATLAGESALIDGYFEGGVDARGLQVTGVTKVRDVQVGRKQSIAMQDTVVAAGARLVVNVQPPAEVGENWLWLANIRCRGTLHVELRRVAYRPKALRVRGLQLGPSGLFRAQVSAPLPDVPSQITKVEALDWQTEPGARVRTPSSVGTSGSFEASGWTGTVIPGFAHAYKTSTSKKS